MTPPLLIALDAAMVLILAVLIAEFAQMRKRRMLQPIAASISSPTGAGDFTSSEFRRPLEWGPPAVDREIIDKVRKAIMRDQMIVLGHRRYSRWNDDDKGQWVDEWVEHDQYDYVLSITGRGVA